MMFLSQVDLTVRVHNVVVRQTVLLQKTKDMHFDASSLLDGDIWGAPVPVDHFLLYSDSWCWEKNHDSTNLVG